MLLRSMHIRTSVFMDLWATTWKAVSIVGEYAPFSINTCRPSFCPTSIEKESTHSLRESRQLIYIIRSDVTFTTFTSKIWEVPPIPPLQSVY